MNYATFKTNKLWDKLLSFLSWHHLFRPSGVKIPLAPNPARSLPTLPKKMKGHSVDVRGGRPSSGLGFVNSKLNYPNLKYFSSSPFPLVFFYRGEKFCMPDAAALIQLWDLVLVTSSKLGRAAEKVVPINPVCRANALLFCSDEDFCQHANWCSGGGRFSTIFWTWNYFYLWEFVFFLLFLCHQTWSDFVPLYFGWIGMTEGTIFHHCVERPSINHVGTFFLNVKPMSYSNSLTITVTEKLSTLTPNKKP